jgi:hypothetical protein
MDDHRGKIEKAMEVRSERRMPPWDVYLLPFILKYEWNIFLYSDFKLRLIWHQTDIDRIGLCGDYVR